MGTPASVDLFGGQNARGEVSVRLESCEPAEVTAWIGSRLVVNQGEHAGQAFKVLPWQREFLEQALAPGVQQAALSIGRGNGKTTLVAALASAFIVGPLRQPRAEVPVVAASYAQARIAFEHVQAFLEREFYPRSDWRVTDSLHWSLIEHKPSRARLRVMSSNPKRAHGLAPALIIADEPAQWSEGDGERMYSALITSLGKIPGSRFVALGTRPRSGAHWFARLLTTDAPGVVAHTFAADEGADIEDESAWEAANPSLPHMPTLRAAIALEARQCRDNPTMVPAFRALRLNQGVDDSDSVQRLVDVEDWLRCEAQEGEPRGPMVWGIDLGGSQAMSTVACYWPDTYRLDCIAEVGNAPSLTQRGMQDGVGGLYEQAAAAGQLSVSDKRVPDVEALVSRALDRWGKPVAVVADRWRLAELQDVGERLLGAVQVVPRGQGFREGADDVRRFRACVKLAHVAPAGRLTLLQAGLSEAVVVSDPAGNWKLAKHNQGGRRQRARDDVVAATILAVGHASRVNDGNAVTVDSPFEMV